MQVVCMIVFTDMGKPSSILKKIINSLNDLARSTIFLGGGHLTKIKGNVIVATTVP